ncbi:MAG: hypothetical protein V7L04_09755 [Nostoc sp.]
MQTANISEVIHTSVMRLNLQIILHILSVLSLLHQQQLYLLPVIDNQYQVVGLVNPESICQALAQKTKKTRGNASIGSFEVAHQIFVERQLLTINGY